MAQVLGISVGAPNLFGEETASVLFTGIGNNGNEMTGGTPSDGFEDTRARLQYFPESLSDSRAVNYETKEIPGGSHPLYQWVAGGERQLSFTAVFTQEIRLTKVSPLTGFFLSPEKHSADIKSAIAWLRHFT